MINGETVTYQYDSLNRLISASASGWSEAYGFDGFDNLTSKTGANAPALSVVVDTTTNRIQGVYGLAYDPQLGNVINMPNGPSSYFILAYDAENRLTSQSMTNPPQGTPSYTYAYDGKNKRIWSWTGSLDPYGWLNASGYSMFLYGLGGQRLGTYQINVFNQGTTSDPNLTLQSTLVTSDLFFGSRRVAVQDRLCSVGNYFPYGESRPGTNPLDTWRFATYWRDSSTSLDYADQRYYSNQFGRFLSPDPARGSAGPNDPGSWNRYAYVTGDPINSNDPTGLEQNYDDGDINDIPTTCTIDGVSLDPASDPLCGGGIGDIGNLSGIAYRLATGRISCRVWAFTQEPAALAQALSTLASPLTSSRKYSVCCRSLLEQVLAPARSSWAESLLEE
jgi:RHS repeat-associated protein